MTYIPGISQAFTTQESSSTTTEKTTKSTLGQDDFLTLLVAQLQNQDPLNPSDPTEFTAQLAQFSELEQLFQLNDSMEQMAQAQNNAERLSAMSLIGKEILVEGSSFQLEEEMPEQIGYHVEGNAEDITIEIRNSQGVTVAALQGNELGPGNHFITWNGMGENGEPLPPGKYDIVIQARGGEEETVAVTPLVRLEVTGVNLAEDGTSLITDLGEFSIAAVQGVYEAETRQEPGETALDGEEESSGGQLEEETMADNLEDEVSEKLFKFW